MTPSQEDALKLTKQINKELISSVLSKKDFVSNAKLRESDASKDSKGRDFSRRRPDVLNKLKDSRELRLQGSAPRRLKRKLARKLKIARSSNSTQSRCEPTLVHKHRLRDRRSKRCSKKNNRPRLQLLMRKESSKKR